MLLMASCTGAVSAQQTATPFLNIIPDARSAAMAETGAATPGDVSSAFMNAAKLAFTRQRSALALSYIPWLSNYSKDINMASMSGYHRLNDQYVAGASVNYFGLGEVDLRDESGQGMGTFSPGEFSADLTIARSFGTAFALGASLRYIQSGTMAPSSTTQDGPVRTFAADVSAYYKQGTVILGYDAELAFGMHISNLGPKIGYTSNTVEKYFLPANLRLGVANTFYTSPSGKFTLAADISKLLVPAYPQKDQSVVSGIFSSFSDAPGGFSEELKEISFSAGAEYSYADDFFLRGGYHYQNPLKGENRYFSTGAGLKYGSFRFDVSYLVGSRSNALANTLRFTLGFYIEGRKD